MLLSGVFDFDPDKSAANLAKHGIDFETAQALWLDEARVELDTQFVDERRTSHVGRGNDRWQTLDGRCDHTPKRNADYFGAAIAR